MPWLAAVIPAVAGVAGAALSQKGAGKTEYPKPVTVNPDETQQNWLNAQQRYLPQEYAYLSQAGALGDQQARQRLFEAAPWAAQYQQQAAQNYGNYLKGAFTPEEEALIRRENASRSAQLGIGNTPYQRNALLGNMLGQLSNRQQSATYAYPSFQSGMTGQLMGQVPSLSSITPTYAQYLNALTGNAATQNEFAMKQAEANAQPNPMLAAVGTSISGLAGMATRYGLSNMNPGAFTGGEIYGGNAPGVTQFGQIQPSGGYYGTGE